MIAEPTPPRDGDEPTEASRRPRRYSSKSEVHLSGWLQERRAGWVANTCENDSYADYLVLCLQTGRKHGCAHCHWSPAGCEECREDYGLGMRAKQARATVKSRDVVMCTLACNDTTLESAGSTALDRSSSDAYRHTTAGFERRAYAASTGP